jgi:translation initiation factor 2 subunit 2
VDTDFQESTDAAAPSATPDGLDVPMKKKKSKKQASDFAKELDELDAEQNDEELSALPADDGGITGENGEKIESWVAENRSATYPEVSLSLCSIMSALSPHTDLQLLRRFFTMLHQHNPELAGEKRRFLIVPPQIQREGTKKTMFGNLTDICRRMHRQPEHVIAFLYTELGTTGSLDGNQRLLMKGRFTQKQMENVLKKYIGESSHCEPGLSQANIDSRICYLQSLQVARYDPQQGEQNVDDDLRVLCFS